MIKTTDEYFNRIEKGDAEYVTTRNGNGGGDVIIREVVIDGFMYKETFRRTMIQDAMGNVLIPATHKNYLPKSKGDIE